MIALMVVVFLIGYVLIALEHPIKINKAGIALFIGTALWIIYMYVAPQVVPHVSGDEFQHYISTHPELKAEDYATQIREFVINSQILESIGDISETILFLLAAMAIVELIDTHGGFVYITDRIITRNKRKLFWLISFITFGMSAVLDNLTTTIVMVMLIRRIVPEPRERWLVGSMIVIAANSGGAWSPIGDVTTIMLWVKGNITVLISPKLILPSLVSMIIPLMFLQFVLKGAIPQIRKSETSENKAILKNFRRKDRLGILAFGVSILVLAPVFKMITHLPPFVWLLFGMSMLWIYTEIIYNHKIGMKEDAKLRLSKVLGRLDIATLMFFLGILLAVDALQSAGILGSLSGFIAEKMPNVYAQGISIGLLSAIIDNVPLVAAAIGMYPVVEAGAVSMASNPGFLQNFVVDGNFWHFLAYCAGVGGSILIIGSAAGVVFMGLEGVSFGWYLKRISLVTLVGYLAGAGVYMLQQMLL